MKKLVICLWLFVGTLARAEEVRWVTPDFALVTAPASLSRTYARPPRELSCAQRIEEALCLVDPPPAGEELPRERICLPGSRGYAPIFRRLYRTYPEHLRKMLCHLKRIYVEKSFIGSAYGGLIEEKGSGRVLGGVLGVRQSLLDEPATLEEWASWKEQIHFGTDPSRVTVAPGLPRVLSSLRSDPLDMLYFLVAHELGHVFDFTNHVNRFTDCAEHKQDCVSSPLPGSWGAFSWKTADTPLDRFRFPLRDALCFYFCEGKFIPASRQNELYRDLAQTNFLSAYATRFATEDFADTFAFYTLLSERHASYRIHTVSGLVYDPMERLQRDSLLAGKREFIARFLRSDLKYPGEE